MCAFHVFETDPFRYRTMQFLHGGLAIGRRCRCGLKNKLEKPIYHSTEVELNEFGVD